MSLNDPIADMLNRIKNAARNHSQQVDCRQNKICVGIAGVLKEEGYLANYTTLDDGKQGVLRIEMQYGPNGEKLIHDIRRQSKPSRRVYAKVEDIPRPLDGLGIAIVSTPNGVLSDRQARAQHVGGELLCTVE